MDYYNNFYSSIKHRKFNTWCKYTERLDTYGCGCEHNCKYCYSKGLLNFRKLWGKPKPANINLIYHKIKTIP